MTKIIAFAGRKQSGKNTCSNFLHGLQLKSFNVIDEFYILNDGKLIIENKDDSGQSSKGVLDITRTDMEFAEWAMEDMWPIVKNYAFADTLKEIGIKLFNIPRELAYGSDEDKNVIMEHLRWENMPGVITPEKSWKLCSDSRACSFSNLSQEESDKIQFFSPRSYNPDNEIWISAFHNTGLLVHKPGPMSIREWLQFFGTEICRKMYDQVWVSNTLKTILNEEPKLAIISDCRFINECEAIKNAGGKVIYLKRGLASADGHISENELDGYNNFDYVIDNNNISLEDTFKEVLSAIDSWGWMS